MVLAFIALLSCSNERLLTEGRYNYLRKVPVNNEQSANSSLAHVPISSLAQKTADTSLAHVPIKNEISQQSTDHSPHNMGHALGNARQQEISERKSHRINKLTERLNKVLFNSSQTQILSSEKLKAKNSQTSDKKQTRVGRFFSKLKDIYNYPPEKILTMILIALVVILLLVILGPIFGVLLVILLLALLLLLLHLYW